MLFPIVSVQLGAAVAKSLFDSLGPGGTVFLRIAFAALVLFLLVLGYSLCQQIYGFFSDIVSEISYRLL